MALSGRLPLLLLHFAAAGAITCVPRSTPLVVRGARASTAVRPAAAAAQPVDAQQPAPPRLLGDGRYLATAAVFSCVLRGGSDLVAQVALRGETINAPHAAAMGVVGLLFSGIVGATWLAQLESRVGGTEQGSVVRKALADYCLYAPLANSAYLFCVPLLSAVFAQHCLLDGTFAHAVSMWREGFGSAMQLEAALCVPYNLLSFRLIPPALRPQAQACMCAAYTLGLSYLC